jgi:hypothetical protein
MVGVFEGVRVSVGVLEGTVGLGPGVELGMRVRVGLTVRVGVGGLPVTVKIPETFQIVPVKMRTW